VVSRGGSRRGGEALGEAAAPYVASTLARSRVLLCSLVCVRSLDCQDCLSLITDGFFEKNGLLKVHEDSYAYFIE